MNELSHTVEMSLEMVNERQAAIRNAVDSNRSLREAGLLPGFLPAFRLSRLGRLLNRRTAAATPAAGELLRAR